MVLLKWSITGRERLIYIHSFQIGCLLSIFPVSLTSIRGLFKTFLFLIFMFRCHIANKCPHKQQSIPQGNVCLVTLHEIPFWNVQNFTKRGENLLRVSPRRDTSWCCFLSKLQSHCFLRGNYRFVLLCKGMLFDAIEHRTFWTCFCTIRIHCRTDFFCWRGPEINTCVLVESHRRPWPSRVLSVYSTSCIQSLWFRYEGQVGGVQGSLLPVGSVVITCNSKRCVVWGCLSTEGEDFTSASSS